MSNIRLDGIGKLDINMLAALHLILQERSISRAAIGFGLSQPAMSNALGRLRGAFGDALLVRSSKGMCLTSRGEQVLEQLGELLPRLGTLAQLETFEPATAEIELHVAATDHATRLLMPLLVERFFKEAPGCSLAVSTVDGREIDTEAPGDRYDLRFGWFVAPPESWYVRRLLVDRMVLIVNPSTGFGERLTIAEFEAARQIGVHARYRLHQSAMDQLLQERGVRRNVALWVSNFSCMPQMIARSSLVALVPESLGRRYEERGEVRVVEPPIELNPFGLSMAWTPQLHRDPQNRWLRALAVRAAAESSAAWVEDEGGAPD